MSETAITLRDRVRAHVLEIQERAVAGNQFEVKTLGAIVLLLNGFPDEGGDGREALEFALPETVRPSRYPLASL